jgi:hydrogenase small subunit
MDRREFLEKVLNILIMAGGSSFITFEELEGFNVSNKKPNLVWLHAQSCDGCSTSLVEGEIPFEDILFNFANIVFHPTIMAATGEEALKQLIEAEEVGNFILVVEGGIPVSMPHACIFGDRFITDWILDLAKKANIVIAAGTCSSFTGICAMEGMYTGDVSLRRFLRDNGVKTPVVNLPTCPMKPHHFLYTFFYYLKTNRLPPLDKENRPLKFFKETIHDRCIYYHDYQEKIFAKKIGERGCLFKLGCQGPVTYNDCEKSPFKYDKYNCIKSGHPCVGCASENFPRTIMFKRYDDEREIVKYKDFKRIL